MGPGTLRGVGVGGQRHLVAVADGAVVEHDGWLRAAHVRLAGQDGLRVDHQLLRGSNVTFLFLLEGNGHGVESRLVVN